jgi:pyruvate dehydrogenase E1 component
MDGHEAERWNLLHPGEEPRIPYVTQCLRSAPGVLVAASDYMKALPDSIYRWFPRPVFSLGTDGFGRSDSRRALRSFFEVDARFITLATLTALHQEKRIDTETLRKAMRDLEIDPEKPDPMTA